MVRGRKPKDLNYIDRLLLDAKTARKSPVAAVPKAVLSKEIIEFAQFYGALKYREAREILSRLAALHKAQVSMIAHAEKGLGFKADNWSLDLWGTSGEMLGLGLIPHTIDSKDGGLISRQKEMRKLLEEDETLQGMRNTLANCLKTENFDQSKIDELITIEFQRGTLEKKLEHFKNKKELKKNTTLSKSLMSNFIDPSKAETIRKEGDLPDLSIGERQAMQFLFGKINTMTTREKYLRDKLLDGDEEDPKKHGFFVVFELTEALKKSYGDIKFDGYHYKNLEQSLIDLLEKKRKLLIETNKETLELSISLLQKLEMRHKFHEEPEFRSFIAVRIPYDVAKLHDKKYTSFPDDHFALLRNTPPKTLLDKTEIRFFDFLRNEAPYKSGKTKPVRRKKEPFLELIGGGGYRDDPGRLAERIESVYITKAINMKLLKTGKIEVNSDGEEVYVFEYQEKLSKNNDC